MKKLLLLALICFLTSCDSSSEVKEIKEVQDPPFLIEKVERFIEEHPDWKNNEIIKDRVNNEFMDSVLKWSKEVMFLDRLPFEVENLQEIKDSGKIYTIAVGKMRAPVGKANSQLINMLDLKLSLLLKPEMVDDIVSGQIYHVFGSIEKLIGVPEGFKYGDYSLGVYRIGVDSLSEAYLP